jgi:zinc protease
MTPLRRVFRAIAVLLLLAPLPGAAQLAAPSHTAAVAAPRYAQPDDPWIYRGTDIPIDEEWLFGEMPNGLRYAVRSNGVPPGQVAIRVLIDAGSLHERDEERGFAHLIEHLTFRESRDFGVGEAIPHFQRLGASLGADTNAVTSPTQTIYKLDLPNGRGPVLEESVRLLSGMIREPTLNAANLAAEVPIVLAERRERSGPDRRILEQSLQVFYASQRLSDRMPIGTVETLQRATAESVGAFHRRWYRPDNAVVVIVGDAEPARLASMVEANFGDWQVPGPLTPEPDFGDPQAPEGSDPANPVGETRVVVEPGQPRGFTYAVLRPWEQVVDNLEYNRGLLIDAIAQAVINRRLESRARSGGSFLYAAVEQDKVSRSADATFVSFAPLSEDWRTPLGEIRSVIADALSAPPSQAEIDRELAGYDVIFANLVEQRRNQAGSRLADDIINAVDIREAVASPETILEVFRGMRDRFTPEAVHQHTRALFEGTVIRALLLTPEPGEADAAMLRSAMLEPVEADRATRASYEAIAFADLPPIGAPVDPAVREPLGVCDNCLLADIEKVTFANGVRALVWRTENEPGRATVRVRFGHGRQAFAKDEAAYLQLGRIALMSAGIGPLGQDEIDRLTGGRKLSLDFRVEPGAFVFDGNTRGEDVADQLYLFAAKLAMPRWDAAPIERARASALLAYDSYRGNPTGVINRDLEWLLHGRDPRFGTPEPDALRQATPEGFERVWSRLLAQGPVEVAVFGDIDREAVVAALSRTFGALPARTPAPAAFEAFEGFPPANTEPLVLRHRGESDQAAAAIAWPTGGGSAGLWVSRQLEVLAQVFSNRLMDAMRERAGASYSPFVGSNWPLDVESGGNVMAVAQLPPEQVPEFFAAAEQIAADLATSGPSDEELARVTEPMRQLLDRLQHGHTLWLGMLQGSSFDPNRVASLGTLERDYTRVTPEDMRALAARFFTGHGGFRVAVLPEPGAAVGGR